MTPTILPGAGEHSDAILERLLALHPKSIDLSLGRMERLLRDLDHPERRLPPVVHVAGTNGKGSVSAFLAAGLAAGGGRVHAYTSPHLARFHERIRVSGRLIEEKALAELLSRCEAANDDAPITFFEITTAAAFLAFAETPAEWLVLEVGLGGRLDATNVIGAPELSVITPVSLDHQQYLGETVGEIAGEKAGIIKPGVPCIVARQAPEALSAIERRAAEIGAPLLVADENWTCRLERGRLVFEDEQGLADLPAPRLLGRHQIDNAGVAIAALRALGRPESACAEAMVQAEWPARLQRLRRGPLIDALPEEAELWLDGGHNPAAGEALAAFFAELEETTPAPLHLICGMINTKDPRGFLAPFHGLARRVIAVPIPGEASATPPEEVAAAAVGVGLQAQTAGSVAGALRAVRTQFEAEFDDDAVRVLVCGSLYLAGRVLRENA